MRTGGKRATTQDLCSEERADTFLCILWAARQKFFVYPLGWQAKWVMRMSHLMEDVFDRQSTVRDVYLGFDLRVEDCLSKTNIQ